MGKEQLLRLLNRNKRLETFYQEKQESILKCILYSHTGQRIVKIYESIIKGMKEPMEIIFKPVKRFTKRDLRSRNPSDAFNPEPLNKKVILPTDVIEPKEDSRSHQKTSIKFVDAEKNETQFNPDNYFF